MIHKPNIRKQEFVGKLIDIGMKKRLNYSLLQIAQYAIDPDAIKSFWNI